MSRSICFLQLDDAQVAAVLDDDLEAAGRAEAGHRRRREQRHRRLGNLAVEQLPAPATVIAVAVIDGIAALVERLERDEEVAEVGAVGVERERLAGDSGDVGDSRQRFHQLADPVDDLLGPLQRGGVGQLHARRKSGPGPGWECSRSAAARTSTTSAPSRPP